MNWVIFWLCIHIIAAVIAFGPTFTFPLIGALVQKMPGHMHFAMELNEVITRRLVFPLAVMMGVSGTGLIIAANVNIFKSTYLLVAIALYLLAMGIAIGVELPTGAKLARLTADMPAGPPSGEIMGLVARARNGGIVLTILFFAIVLLMIIKPGGIVFN